MSRRACGPLPVVLAAAVAVAGCDSPAGTLGPGDLAIGTAPDSVFVPAGTIAAVTVSIVRGGSFDGPVTLGAVGVPSGVMVSSGVVSAVEDVGVVTFGADCGAVGESTTVTITAVPDGAHGRATSEIVVTVVEPEEGCFSFATARDTVKVQPGVPDTTVVTIARGPGLTSSIDFTAAGMPAGLTATFVESPVAGDTARLVLTADSALATYTPYVVTLTASAEDLRPRTDSVAVVVAPAGTFSLRLVPDSLTLVPGGSDATTVVIDRGTGLTDVVSIVLDYIPAEITALTASDTVAAGDTVAVPGAALDLVFSADSTAVVGTTWAIPVRGFAESATSEVTDTLYVSVSGGEGGPALHSTKRRPRGS